MLNLNNTSHILLIVLTCFVFTLCITFYVKKIARQVTLTKVDVKLDPMNSFQRRIVHNALSKFDYIKTESIGTEPNRCVVIKYKEKNEE